MGLFICENCECVENTVLGHYWSRHNNDLYAEEYVDKALCSECAPTHFKSGEPIKRATGKWHGKFDKLKYTKEELDSGFFLNGNKFSDKD